jgi:hypothetical protein
MILLLLAMMQAEVPAATVPERFRGEWAYTPGLCGEVRTALRITETRFDSLAEYNGEIERVIEDHGTSIKVSVRFWEGSFRWEGVQALTLNETGNELTNHPARPADKYYRCTPKRGERG